MKGGCKVSPGFYLPFQHGVLKWDFDLSGHNSAEGKDGVSLLFDISLWFAVDFKSSPIFFSLEFTGSDFHCRENMETVFSLATKCCLIVASFSAIFSSALISLVSVTICLGAWYYTLWTRPRVSEGLGRCCLLLRIMKIVVFASGRWAGAGGHIEMQNMCWGWAIYSSLKRRFGCWASGTYLVCRDSFLLPFSGP